MVGIAIRVPERAKEKEGGEEAARVNERVESGQEPRGRSQRKRREWKTWKAEVAVEKRCSLAGRVQNEMVEWEVSHV